MPNGTNKAFVILHPGSLTNHSDSYRVAAYSAWVHAYNTGTQAAYVAEFDDLPPAAEMRDDLNGDVNT